MNAVADKYTEVLTKNFEKTVKEKLRKAQDDRQVEIKSEEKSPESVNKAIKNLIGSIGK